MVEDVPAGLSANQLKRLGTALRAQRLTEESEYWPMYVEYLTHCNALQQVAEERVRSSLPGSLIVTGRTKSRDTLREKLLRSPTMQLPSIDDVIGIRVVGDLTLAEQDRVAESIDEQFDGALKIRDRRIDPSAGYRALHVIVKEDGLRAEVQVRTRLQAVWADLFERLADVWGRQIRYGLAPDPDASGQTEARVRHIRALQQMSTEFIAPYEVALSDHAERPSRPRSNRLASRNMSRTALAAAMRARETEKGLIGMNASMDAALADFRTALVRSLEELAQESESIP